MLHLEEIREAIAEIEGQRDHSVNDLQVLSCLYSIRDHAFGEQEKPDMYQRPYSQAAAPIAESSALGNYGDSEFLLVVAGKLPDDAWKVMDDLMDTLRVSYPRVYNSVMRRMREL